MPYLNEKKIRSKIVVINDEVREIRQEYNKPATLNGNREFMGVCLMCANPRCLKYEEQEIGNIKCFSEFSYERNYSVCPFAAIYQEEYQNEIIIDVHKCVNCGLCAARCPVGAIYFTEEGTVINKDVTVDYKELQYNENNIKEQEEQIKKLLYMGRENRYTYESELQLSHIYNRVKSYDGRSQIHNLLVRNLMISLGYNCAISRMGDVYTRMDAVYAKDNCYGVVEIEFGRDTLEASRGILDDVAVLQSRSKINKENNVPIVVCLSLPNKRQGYFQVVKDIDRVLNIQIQTLTLGSLLVLLWNGAQLNFSKKLFYADFDNMSIRKAVEEILKRTIRISDNYLGIFEPEK